MTNYFEPLARIDAAIRGLYMPVLDTTEVKECLDEIRDAVSSLKPAPVKRVSCKEPVTVENAVAKIERRLGYLQENIKKQDKCFRILTHLLGTLRLTGQKVLKCDDTHQVAQLKQDLERFHATFLSNYGTLAHIVKKKPVQVRLKDLVRDVREAYRGMQEKVQKRLDWQKNLVITPYEEELRERRERLMRAGPQCQC